MAKKKFSGIDSLLQDTSVPKEKEKKKGSKSMATYTYDKEQLEKIRNLAYWDRVNINEIIYEALSDYLTKYEKKNGEIKSRK